MTFKKMNVAIYARVSTDSQELQQQIDACERFCDFKDFTVLKIYDDVGSGKSYKNRKGFVQMLDDVRQLKYKGIVVFRLDRLFRNVVEAVNIIQEFDNKNIEIFSISESLDTSTAIGRAMRDIILVLAKLERENIIEATKERLQALKDSGKKLGRPSISQFKIDKIKELRKAGYSYRKIAEEMHIKKSTVAKYSKGCPQKGGDEKSL